MADAIVLPAGLSGPGRGAAGSHRTARGSQQPGGGGREPERQSAGLPKLQSVVLGNGPALAVLNGKSYRVGQQVEGYRLVAISADAVVLEKGGKRQSLTLFASKIRI